MLNRGTFKPNELRPVEYQHTIRHTSTNSFEVGEKIFLKSNPEYPLEVIELTDKKVIAKWCHGEEVDEFPPECVLQYRYIALLTYKKKYFICLN